MIVSELISELEKLDQDLYCVCSHSLGYDGVCGHLYFTSDENNLFIRCYFDDRCAFESDAKHLNDGWRTFSFQNSEDYSYACFNKNWGYTTVRSIVADLKNYKQDLRVVCCGYDFLSNKRDAFYPDFFLDTEQYVLRDELVEIDDDFVVRKDVKLKTIYVISGYKPYNENEDEQ